jgi:hypothetical protein
MRRDCDQPGEKWESLKQDSVNKRVKKVLAISPHFVPANKPDMQRLRMAMPYFRENGWEATVVTLDMRDYTPPLDEALTETIPQDAKIIRLRAWSERKCRRLGFGHIANRIAWPWRKEVRRILQDGGFDLVFFTTTQAMVMINGPYWQRAARMPYVIDLQDPIYVPGGAYSRANAPGSYWKYKMANFLNRYVERIAFSSPAAVVATSPHYLDTLRQRYPRLNQTLMKALPFGLPEKDLEMCASLAGKTPIFSRKNRESIVFYAGRGGPDLHPALQALFRCASELCRENPALREQLRFIFVGTSYGPAGTGVRQVAPIAEACGCGPLVSDDPERYPYFDVLAATRDAAAALVLGSMRADYTASKALMALAAARRVLAIVHDDSLVKRLYEKHPKVLLCSFAESPLEEACLEKIRRSLVDIAAGCFGVPDKVAVAEEHTARGMTKELCRVFEEAVKR